MGSRIGPFEIIVYVCQVFHVTFMSDCIIGATFPGNGACWFLPHRLSYIPSVKLFPCLNGLLLRVAITGGRYPLPLLVFASTGSHLLDLLIFVRWIWRHPKHVPTCL